MPALHNIVPQCFDGLTRFLPCVPAMLAEMLLLKLTRRDAENEASAYKIEECHHDKQQINRLYMQREKDQVQRKGRKDMGHNASQHEITNGRDSVIVILNNESPGISSRSPTRRGMDALSAGIKN